MIPYILIRGGGDLASGVALRLQHVGLHVLVVEIAQPLAVRRSVAFAQAVFDGQTEIEGVIGVLIRASNEAQGVWARGAIPVLVDPDLDILKDYPPLVLVDARMRKKHIDQDLSLAKLVIGLGPGFLAGDNCHAAIETNRGHFMGRVYWEGEPEANTGIPGEVQFYTEERVLRAPARGKLETHVDIGDPVQMGESILTVAGQDVTAPFDGVVRGLIHAGIEVKKGLKVGDVDPRPETLRCWTVSEKSLAIGGGVLEAILSRENIRSHIWNT